jgi:oligosaccharide repeat unit polymerase
MEISLFIIIISMLIFYCMIINFDLLNPGTWLLSTMINMFYSSKWGIKINSMTIWVVAIGTIAFCLGILMIAFLYESKKNRCNISKSINIKKQELNIRRFKLYIIYMYIIISAIIMFQEVYKVSILAGNTKGYAEMIKYARLGATHYNLGFGKLTANLLRINYSLGIVIFYIFCNGVFEKKVSKERKELFIVSIISLCLSSFSTGRTQFLGMISAYLMILLFEYARCYAWKNNRYMKKVFKWIIIGCLIFVGMFTLSGIFTLDRMGNSTINDIIDNIALYIGSPISCLSYFIENISSYGQPMYFGENTFISIYGTLKSLGVVEIIPDVFLPPVVTANFRSNVYTLYYHYIYDFGILGAIFIQLINGIIYGWLYYRIKYSIVERVYTKLIYVILMYSLVMMFFQETLYSMLNTHIIRFIASIIIYKILTSNINIIKNIKIV